MLMKKLFYILIYFISYSETKELHVPFCSAWNPNHTLIIGSPSGSPGNTTSTLKNPTALVIDRKTDTVYVVDSGNNRIMKFENNSNIGEQVSFKNSSDTRRLFKRFDLAFASTDATYIDRTENNSNSGENVSSEESSYDGELLKPYDLVFDSSGAMYISDTGNNRIVKWSVESENRKVIVKIESPKGIHLDEEKGYLYIVRDSYPAIIRYDLKFKRTKKVAGDNRRGRTATLANLNNPIGVYVDRNDNIYVAEYSGPYITKWRDDQSSGKVVAGIFADGTSKLAALDSPASIFVDDQDTMYITDVRNNQVLRWAKNVTSGECILGCNNILVGNITVKLNEIKQPYDIAFDSRFNLYILENSKHRIKRFNIYFILSCMLQYCRPPTIHLEPHSPVHIRSQSMTFTITAELDCYIWITTDMRCRARACYPGDEECIETNELNNLVTSFIQPNSYNLVIPPFGLPVGTYHFTCTIRMTDTKLESWILTTLQIVRSPVIIKLRPIGKSEIVVGYRQDFELHPDVISKTEDKSYLRGMNFVYYCRKYPNHNYSTLSIDDDSQKGIQSACFNLAAKPNSFVYDDPSNRSSLRILSQSLEISQTYEFYVEMYNENGLVDKSDTVLVKIVPNDVFNIDITSAFDFLTLDNDYSLFNPSTQLILYSSSNNQLFNGEISWKIYEGTTNLQWTPYIYPTDLIDRWFYGINTTMFTIISEFFLSKSSIDYWRFEVIYSNKDQTSSAAIQLKTNHLPLKTNCSIDSFNGTTKTLFTFICANWKDLDEIKDYFLHVLSTRNTIQMSIAHSNQSTFTTYLPAGDPKLNYLLRLIIHVRDGLGAWIESNIIELQVIPDEEFLNTISKFSINNTDLLESNENQFIQSFAVILNQMAVKEEESLMKSSVKISEYLISNFETERANNLITNKKTNASLIFLRNQHHRSIIREYLLEIFQAFPQPTSIEQMILLSSTINQLTNTISEWTQTSFALAANICEQYANITYHFSRETTFEQIILVAKALAPCSSNIFTGVNAPLQQRGFIFEETFDEQDFLFDDNEEEVVFFDYEYFEIPSCHIITLRKSQKCKEISVDKYNQRHESYHRNRIYYLQKLLAMKLGHQIDGMIVYLAKSLRRHLNLFQKLAIVYPSLRMLVEQISPNALENKWIDLNIRNASIYIPKNLSYVFSEQLGIRTTLLPLAPADGTVNVSLSTGLTFSVLNDEDSQLKINTTKHSLIEMFIPRDINLFHPIFSRQNLTRSRIPKYGKFKVNRQYFIYFINTTQQHPNITTSIHFELMPMYNNISFGIIYKFAHVPAWNMSHKIIDGSAMFCSRNLSEEMNYYRFYLDNEQTAGHKSLYLGIREIDEEEACSNLLPRVTNQPYGFSQDVFIRIYTSGCFFLDEGEQWQSLGLKVGPKTNIEHTHCFSNHT